LIGIISGAYGGVALSKYVTPWLIQLPALIPYADQLAVLIVVSLITYFSIVLGELVPKSIAMNNPEKIAIAISPFITVFTKFTNPIVSFLSMSTKLFTRMFLIKENDGDKISEEEIKTMIKLANIQGTIETKESELHHNIFRFADRRAYHIMTHRSDVTWIDVRATQEEIEQSIKESGYSKFLVCEDEIENVVGVLTLKSYIEAQQSKVFNLREILDEPFYIPENLTALKILEQFRKNRNYFGIVVNEYGSLEGIITLHDLTENIFGYLPDEDEAEDESPIIIRADGSLLVDGSVLIDELSEMVHLEAFFEDDKEYSTIAGFVFEKLNKIPHSGDNFEEGEYSFEILDMDKSRIDKILITRKDAEVSVQQPISTDKVD
nr:HlyC/CorC family transporter [Saprospiraceae bacterium]